ncbi:MAG: HAMP domain-containing histidine kinase [Deltaproteobacteria bacterium]|nr:HAMP domain-containing histidine kinase [Deltaproteobacteria bacterium]
MNDPDLATAAASVAHELRGDLGVIRNCAWLVRRGAGLPPQADEWLRTIEARVAAAQGLVRDLGDLAHPPAIEPRDVALAPILRDAADLVALELTGVAGVEVRTDCPSDLRARLDPEAASRAVRNLVRNAVQALAARGGGIVATAARDCGDLVLAVADDGPGLPPDLPDPFRPFATGRKDGTGLGLAIVRAIVEAHGGRVEAGSAPGGGAAFVLRFPGAASGCREGT